MKVLITRPVSQAKSLVKLCQAQNHSVFLFPTLEIKPLSATPLEKDYDILIFISVNAVNYALQTLRTLRYQTIFAVGSATAKRLNECGFQVDGFPADKASSEALLALPEVANLSEKRILIVRGKGGREALKEKLSIKNQVQYLEAYDRVQSQVSPAHKIALLDFLKTESGVITITSVDSLIAMISMIKTIDLNYVEAIKRYPLAVLSLRIKKYAESIGFQYVSVATQIGDAGLIQVLKRIS